MICPKCGFSGNFIVNGDRFCASCSCFIAKAFPSEQPSISGLEKIEPLKVPSVFNNIFSNDDAVASKLNQVIENQNKIIDYLNQQVKK